MRRCLRYAKESPHTALDRRDCDGAAVPDSLRPPLISGFLLISPIDLPRPFFPTCSHFAVGVRPNPLKCGERIR